MKASMFSYQRLDGADPVTGVEMGSTGEVGCLGKDFNQAMILSLEATQIKKPVKGILVSSGRERDKIKFMEVVENLYKLNVPVYATTGTADYLKSRGYNVHAVNWTEDPKAINVIKDGKVDFVINIHKTFDIAERKENATIRKAAIKCGCSLLTNMEKVIAYLKSLDEYDKLQNVECINL